MLAVVHVKVLLSYLRDPAFVIIILNEVELASRTALVFDSSLLANLIEDSFDPEYSDEPFHIRNHLFVYLLCLIVRA